MMRMGFSNKLAIMAAASLCIAPTAASAASSAPTLTGYSPIVTLSVLGSGVSAAALCGAAAASAAQAPAGGCVLPAVDAPPPVAVVEPAPLPPPPLPAAVPAASSGFLVPLIGGLAALVAVLALIGFGKHNHNGGSTPPPVTPQ